jgi:hypothetical protein
MTNSSHLSSKTFVTAGTNNNGTIHRLSIAVKDKLQSSEVSPDACAARSACIPKHCHRLVEFPRELPVSRRGSFLLLTFARSMITLGYYEHYLPILQ